MKLRKPCNCQALIKAIDAYIQKADDDLEESLSDAGFALPKETAKTISEMEEELTKLLKENTKLIVAKLEDYEDIRDFLNTEWPELQSDPEFIKKLTRTFESYFTDNIPDYVTEYIKRTDPELTALGLTLETTTWISEWSNELADLMKLNDNKVIENILTESLNEGSSVVDTAKKIADSSLRDPGYRSRRVATTELLRAHSVAQQESFMQSPAVEGKMWRHSGWRQYARANHMAMDGQTVAKDEPFTLYGADGGVYYPMYPRDSGLPAGESINCGCISEPVVSEEVLGLSLEERQRLQEEAINELDEEFDRKLDEQNKARSFQT